MRAAWRVGENLWLGIARVDWGLRGALPERFGLDRRASRLAEGAAVAASARAQSHLVRCRAHTGGTGAAVVGLPGARIGVDLVRADRVTARHRAAILHPQEEAALEQHGPGCAALAWGIKEAAAKATGHPLRCFPDGLRIEQVAAEIVVRLLGAPQACFACDWISLGGLLCVWVREMEPGNGPVPRSTGMQ